jgi:peptidyl-dipeptidase A
MSRFLRLSPLTAIWLIVGPIVGAAPAEAPPTAAEAKSFIDDAEARLLKLSVDGQRSSWVQSTFITDDTEILAAQANERVIGATVDYAKQAVRFDALPLSEMCIDVTTDDFRTIHHELGHNFYQRAYDRQPFLFRDSANDGFHEAIGDTIALSITPAYLVKLGFLKAEPAPSKDIGLLLRQALDKIAFLPFGLLVDKWRWEVYSGAVPPEKYNEAWWSLRRKYQGIAPPVPRSEKDFDPAAKYHVAGNVPYARYFLADILQFQFHRSLSKVAGCSAPLNRCSIYESKEAGRRLNAMLEMGCSKPWPDALQALTGQREMDATAILDYFAPLQKWLDQQNRGKPVGWN